MKSIVCIVLLVGFVSIIRHVLRAESGITIPVRAQVYHTVYRIDESGTRTLVKEERGVYLRASNGSLRTVLYPVVNGVQQKTPEKEFLTDGTTGNVYDLTYSKREAHLLQRMPVPVVYKKPSASSFSGEQVINGTLCKKRKVLCQDAVLKTKEECGLGWYSPQYDLHVKIETYQVMRDGAQSVDVRELLNIELREPSPDSFRLPENFFVTGAN